VIDAEKTFHAYHRELMDRLRAGIRELDEQGSDGTENLVGRLTDLAEDFVRYVEANEAWLYPAVTPLVRSDEQVMAPMKMDVRAIADYASDGEELAMETMTATEEGQRSRLQRIERLAAQFEAVMQLHLDKLERIYLPLLAELSPEQRRAILAGMSVDYEQEPATSEPAPSSG
jgi:hypothetical protein